MNNVWFLLLSVLLALVSSEEYLRCNADNCQPPKCHCGGRTIPGNLLPDETPQFILLTFDDSVNQINYKFFQGLLDKPRKNNRGCRARATFFVDGRYTAADTVAQLYWMGNEIASHTLGHPYLKPTLSQNQWVYQFANHMHRLASTSKIPLEDIRGFRAPYLHMAGDKMFLELEKVGIKYDSSLTVKEPEWPFTLDRPLKHRCNSGTCPVLPHPGFYEIPLSQLRDQDTPCPMADSCNFGGTAASIFRGLYKNFLRFHKERTPFPLFMHAAWFQRNPEAYTALDKFIGAVMEKVPDVYFVTMSQLIRWMEDPRSVEQMARDNPLKC